MSEYVTVEAQPTADPNVLEIVINQTLTDQIEEVYHSYAEGDEGSPIAQMLFNGVNGIAALTIRPHHLIVTREAETSWEDIIDETRDALRDFFL